jgi:phospholipase/carboxylesterase
MSRFRPSMSWNEPANPRQSDTPNETWDEHCLDWSTETSGLGPDHSLTAANQHESPASQPWGCHHESPLGHFGHRSFFLPLHYEPNYRYPLIVWLHSNGFNENQIDHVMPHVSVRNYVAAGVRGIRAADSIGHRFDWHDSPAAVSAAEEAVSQTVGEAVQRFSIHPSRIVLAGYGVGGTMAIRIAMRAPNDFAAVVSLGGAMPQGRHLLSNLAQLRRRRMPMLWSWATSGARFDAHRLGQDIRLAMMMKASVEIRQYPTEDEMDTVALSDLNDWIMRRVVADQPTQADQRWATSPTNYSAN